MIPATIVIFFYLLGLAAISLARPRYFSSPRLYLLRALFPSWKFFEDAGEVPLLYYRVSETNSGELGSWIPYHRPAAFSWLALLSNPQGVEAHACRSLWQQLMTDCAEAPEKIENGVSYRLVKRVVDLRIKEASHLKKFQFKIATLNSLDPQAEPDDVIISGVYDIPEVSTP